jgi:cation-transporting P-type ATPase E
MKPNPQIPSGLNDSDVLERIEKGHINKTKHTNIKSVPQIILGNILTFFNLILALLAVLLLSIGSFENTIFLPIALANTLIGIIQELKARRTIMKLSLLSEPTALVRRNSVEIEIQNEAIVLDDTMHLIAGKQIVADAIVEYGEIAVNEANLTGEPDAIYKKTGDKILSGSFVVSGDAYTKVVAVGKDNYIEILSAKVKTLGTTTSEILFSLRKLLKIIGIFIIPLGLLTYYTAFKNSGMDYLLDFMQDVALSQDAMKRMAGSMIAMVPSGLFLLTTFTFAASVVKLSKHQTLVRQLYSIETLARVDMICLDKTGTITDGTMKVDSFVFIENIVTTTPEDTTDTEEPLDLSIASKYDVKTIMTSMNAALSDNNQTAVALKKYFGKKRKLRAKEILNFDSKNKYSVVQFEEQCFALGAPEIIAKGQYQKIRKQVERYARLGKRVLLLADVGGIKDNQLHGPVTPIALILINDNIRETAPDTLKSFVDAGVIVKIISGDNALTVSDVASRAGVPHANKYLSLDKITDDKLREVALQYTVFGRVTPAQKKLLIETFQAANHKVAMVGDGVNDILALKAADCSVALAGGSEAARNISHLVLLDNDFASMPIIVREGRQIVNNMQNASVLYLVKTVYTILLTVILLLTRNIYPFEPVHMFVIETFIIGIPTFLLAVEPNDRRFSGKFLRNVFQTVIPGAILVIANLLGVFLFAQFWPAITGGEISTVGIVAATFAYLLILVHVCMPLNKRRGLLVSFAAIASFGSFILLGQQVFKLSLLTVPSLLLLLLLMETTYVVASIYKKTLIKFWA